MGTSEKDVAYEWAKVRGKPVEVKHPWTCGPPPPAGPCETCGRLLDAKTAAFWEYMERRITLRECLRVIDEIDRAFGILL